MQPFPLTGGKSSWEYLSLYWESQLRMYSINAKSLLLAKIRTVYQCVSVPFTEPAGTPIERDDEKSDVCLAFLQMSFHTFLWPFPRFLFFHLYAEIPG